METLPPELMYKQLDYLSTLSDWKNFGEAYNLINSYFWIKLTQKFKNIALFDIINLNWLEALAVLTFTKQELDTILLKLPTNVDCEIIRILVTIHGADVNAVSLTSENTPLLRYYHSLAIMSVLLSSGANPNMTDSNGTAPIHKARILSQLKLLVKYNADINITSRGESVLMTWVRYGIVEGVRFLIKNGARFYEKENLPYKISEPMKQLLLDSKLMDL